MSELEIVKAENLELKEKLKKANARIDVLSERVRQLNKDNSDAKFIKDNPEFAEEI